MCMSFLKTTHFEDDPCNFDIDQDPIALSSRCTPCDRTRIPAPRSGFAPDIQTSANHREQSSSSHRPAIATERLLCPTVRKKSRTGVHKPLPVGHQQTYVFG